MGLMIEFLFTKRRCYYDSSVASHSCTLCNSYHYIRRSQLLWTILPSTNPPQVTL